MIIGGDFNEVRSRSERSNCRGREKGSREFDFLIHNCKLVDFPFLGINLHGMVLIIKEVDLIDFYWMNSSWFNLRTYNSWVKEIDFRSHLNTTCK